MNSTGAPGKPGLTRRDILELRERIVVGDDLSADEAQFVIACIDKAMGPHIVPDEETVNGAVPPTAQKTLIAASLAYLNGEMNIGEFFERTVIAMTDARDNEKAMQWLARAIQQGTVR